MARGSVKPRRNAAGEITSWRVTYDVPTTDGTRKQKVESARTRKEAERLLRERLGAIDGGGYVPPSSETVAEFLRRWLGIRAAGWRASTAKNKRLTIEGVLIPALGDRRLTALRTVEIEAWIAGRADERCASTINGWVALLNGALRDAQRWGLIGRNPAAGVKPVGLPSKERVALSGKETAALLAAGGADAGLWRLMVETGMRIGEATGLKWADVDLDGGTLRVERTIRITREGWIESPPKTKLSRRVIMLSDELVACLKAQRREQRERRLAHPAWTATDFVFDRGDGRPLGLRPAEGRLAKACARAGIRRVTPHGLRHTMATTAFRLGMPAKSVQEQLGHSSVAITMDTYTRIEEEQKRALAGALGKAFGELRYSGVTKPGDGTEKSA